MNCLECLYQKSRNPKRQVNPQKQGSVFCDECQPTSYEKPLANNHTYYLAGKKKLEFYTVKDKKTGKEKLKHRIIPNPCVIGAQADNRDLVAYLYATFMRFHDVSSSPDPTDGSSHFYAENGREIVKVVIGGNSTTKKVIDLEQRYLFSENPLSK